MHWVRAYLKEMHRAQEGTRPAPLRTWYHKIRAILRRRKH